MDRDKPNRNQFKLKWFKPKVFILKPIFENGFKLYRFSLTKPVSKKINHLNDYFLRF